MLNKKEQQGFLAWMSDFDSEYDYRSVRAHHEIESSTSKERINVITKWLEAAYNAGIRFGEKKWNG